MKRLLVIAPLLLASAPARADFFSDLFWAAPSLRKTQRTARHYRSVPLPPRRPASFWALASYYGGGPKKFEPNSHMANGKRFNQWAMVVAHRTLPFGTRLQVCFHGCADAVVGDRGPAIWTGRSLDVSRGVAARIGMLAAGVGRVSVTRLD
jgi:rare lipoprotein A